MAQSCGFGSNIINIIITIFVINLVLRIIKKHTQSQKNNDSSVSQQQKDGEKTIIIHKNTLPQNNKNDSKNDLLLKRCSDCGGEIPVTMMKCELCGKSQIGCSVTPWLIFAVVAFLVVAFYLKNTGLSIRDVMSFFQCWIIR